jgi:hypothetical protein
MAARKPRAKKKQAWYQQMNWRRWGWLAIELVADQAIQIDTGHQQTGE